MVSDVQQMVAQVRVEFSKFEDTSTFKAIQSYKPESRSFAHRIVGLSYISDIFGLFVMKI